MNTSSVLICTISSCIQVTVTRDFRLLGFSSQLERPRYTVQYNILYTITNLKSHTNSPSYFITKESCSMQLYSTKGTRFCEDRTRKHGDIQGYTDISTGHNTPREYEFCEVFYSGELISYF